MSLSVSLPEWRITKGCRLLWHDWDGEYVIYNTGSGDTHLLDMTSAEVLKILEEQSSEKSQLVVRSAQRLGLNDDPANANRIEELLAKFYDLGLVEPVLP